MRPIPEQVVLVCGGSRGIGRAVAERFSTHGSSIVIHYKEQHEQAHEVARHCRDNGSDVLCVAADVCDRGAVFDMVSASIEHFGRLDSIVYCSGISRVGLLQDMAPGDYDALMDTHVRGLFNVAQAAAPHLLAQKQGRIVVLSSIWGSTGGAGEVLYSAAKGAVNAFTKALAKEWAPSGITVNALAPGAIDTGMLDHWDETDIQAITDIIPLDRLGTTAEIAHWVIHLCQPESRYMTGQVIHVNGGWFTP